MNDTRSTRTQDEGSAMGLLFEILKVLVAYDVVMCAIGLLTGRAVSFLPAPHDPVLMALGANAARAYIEKHKGEAWIGFGAAPVAVPAKPALDAAKRLPSIPRTLPRQPGSESARRLVAGRRTATSP